MAFMAISSPLEASLPICLLRSTAQEALQAKHDEEHMTGILAACADYARCLGAGNRGLKAWRNVVLKEQITKAGVEGDAKAQAKLAARRAEQLANINMRMRA